MIMNLNMKQIQSALVATIVPLHPKEEANFGQIKQRTICVFESVKIKGAKICANPKKRKLR